MKIFGDILPSELPTTVDGAMKMMNDLPRLIQKYNDGRGKPLVYVMFPLSSPAFQNNLFINIPKNRAIKKIDEEQVVRSIRTYDHILELIQKAHDQVEEMTVHSYCVTESERNKACSSAETLEVQESSFRSELQKVVIALRSGNSDSSAIPDLCTKNDQEAKKTFEKCEKIFNAMRSRIMFVKRCERYGANHLESPVSEHIAKACDDHENVYVLFHNKAESKTIQRYQSAFIELAKNSKNSENDSKNDGPKNDKKLLVM